MIPLEVDKGFALTQLKVSPFSSGYTYERVLSGIERQRTSPSLSSIKQLLPGLCQIVPLLLRLESGCVPSKRQSHSSPSCRFAIALGSVMGLANADVSLRASKRKRMVCVICILALFRFVIEESEARIEKRAYQ